MLIRDHSVHADYRLGSKQALTPEGFLLCMDVPIARTGTQQYLAEELPALVAGRDGIIHVERREQEVFDPATIMSFEGKDVVDDHPDEMVHPGTYKTHTVGVVLRPRRGEGIDNDLIIADLLIKDADAIAAVRAGKREVSCGYDADYEQLEPGRARQMKIIGNHVALVDRGRCGSRCSIGDQDMYTKDEGKAAKPGWFDRLMGAVKSGDAGAIERVASEAKDGISESPAGYGGSVVHVNLNHGATGINGLDEKAKMEDTEKEKEGEKEPSWFKDYRTSNDKRMGDLEKMCGDMKKTVDARAKDKDDTEEEGESESEGEVMDAEGEEEEENGKKEAKDKKGTKDSAEAISARKAAFQRVKAGCEILAPGLKTGTFDAMLSGVKTTDALCLMKRRAIAASAKTEDGAKVLRTITGKGKLNLTTMDCKSVDMLFNSAVAMNAATNDELSIDLHPDRAKGSRAARGAEDAGSSISAFNAAKNAFWEQKGKGH